MKVILLAGGLGTRLAEETGARPKPMVEIGGKPMLWHIMNIYAKHGFNDFIVAAGYKSEVIKEYFSNFMIHNSDVLIDLKDGVRRMLNSTTPDWRIAVVDTGLDTHTGGRLKRLKDWLEDATFLATYGDGLSDVNLKALLDFHRAHKKLATVTAVNPSPRFGSLELEGSTVKRFSEKARPSDDWINGGFFVFEPGMLDYIAGDSTPLEREPLEKLASEGQLMAFCHKGFWHPMDTLRDKLYLESLWNSGRAPWKNW